MIKIQLLKHRKGFSKLTFEEKKIIIHEFRELLIEIGPLQVEDINYLRSSKYELDRIIFYNILEQNIERKHEKIIFEQVIIEAEKVISLGVKSKMALYYAVKSFLKFSQFKNFEFHNVESKKFEIEYIIKKLIAQNLFGNVDKLEVKLNELLEELNKAIDKSIIPVTNEKLVLIMKGGGIKGLAYVGALEILEEYFEFDWYAGTSAGAISAILLGSGYKISELKEILSNKDFTDFKDAGILKRFLNLIFLGGLYPADKFTNWIDELLAKKLNSAVEIRLKDLPKRVTVYASQEGRISLTFDSKNPQSESIRAAFAARCSMSIPYIFTAQKNEGIDVFDGGLQNNYPVKLLLRDNPNTDFIGLYLGPEIFEGHKKKSILKKIISIWTESVDTEVLRKYKNKTIIIDTRPISTLNFNLNQEEKDFLLNNGKAAAIKYLKNQNIKYSGQYDYVELQKNIDQSRQSLNKRKKANRILILIKFLFIISSIIFGLIFINKHLEDKINEDVQTLFDLQDQETLTEEEMLNGVVKVIAKIGGWNPNFKVKKNPGQHDWIGTSSIDERVIMFDPEFMNELKEVTNSYWPAIFMTTFQMAWILNGPRFGQDKELKVNEMKLDACYTAGFILGKLKAPLDETLKALKLVDIDDSDIDDSDIELEDLENSEEFNLIKEELKSAEKGWRASKN